MGILQFLFLFNVYMVHLCNTHKLILDGMFNMFAVHLCILVLVICVKKDLLWKKEADQVDWRDTFICD